MNQKGFSLLELIVVIVVISILAFVGSRQLDTGIDSRRFEETVDELETIKTALIGDDSEVAFGSRTDFGYFGENGVWPGNLSLLSNFITVADPADLLTDAWGNSYVITSNATNYIVTSRGADGGVGGAGVNQDLSFTIPKANFDNCTARVYIHDSRGTLLTPCLDSGGMRTGHISGVTVVQAQGNDVYWATGAVTATGLGFSLDNNVWTITGLDAGQQTTVQVRVAAGTGTQSPYYHGTYDWRPELLGAGVNTYEVDYIVYPNTVNLFIVKLPGVALQGINEV